MTSVPSSSRNGGSKISGILPTRFVLSQGCLACGPWVAVSVLLLPRLSHAQEGLRNALAGEAAAEARRLKPEAMNYTIKSGDFRLLAAPTFGIDWNDNINASKSDPQQDVILRPAMAIDLSYPITDHNLLQLHTIVGYDQYLKHDELSTLRLGAGSGLSFDVFVKDVQINLHDRFQYTRDAAQEAQVANAANYGLINNTAGLLMTWDLEDVTLSAGYDHANVISPETDFQSQDRTSEMFSGRIGLRLNPAVTAGLEGTAALTAYDKMVLNNNNSYSLGIYGDWQPGPALHVMPRAGYTIFQFQETSTFIRTSDINSWYVDLSVYHQVTEAIGYTFSAGHDVRVGIESDATEEWYLRPSITWNVMKDVSLVTFFSYEHGRQGVGNRIGNLVETYDWLGAGLSLTYPLHRRLTIGLSYRVTFRSSDIADRGYSQNVVSLQMTYVPQ